MKKYLFLFLSFHFSGCLVLNTIVQAKDNKGIGFEILDLEKENGYKVDQNIYLELDSIVNTCKSRIKTQKYSEYLHQLYKNNIN